MKNKRYIWMAGILLGSLSFSCNKMLVEENHSNLTPDFFKTAQGFEKGIVSAYAGLRDFYGPEEGIEAFSAVGTDEFRTANGNRTSNVANYNISYFSNNEFSAKVWNSSYKFINTCNGLLKFGANVPGLSDEQRHQKLAEAHFLRAFYYFTLITYFGDVTLNTEFFDTPTTAAERNPTSEVYKLIIEDLQIASKDLPASPKSNGIQAGRASAVAAKHLLAKVYLTRAYGKDAATDNFQHAFTVSKELINELRLMGCHYLLQMSLNRPTNKTQKFYSLSSIRAIWFLTDHILGITST